MRGVVHYLADHVRKTTACETEERDEREGLALGAFCGIVILMVLFSALTILAHRLSELS